MGGGKLKLENSRLKVKFRVWLPIGGKGGPMIFVIDGNP